MLKLNASLIEQNIIFSHKRNKTENLYRWQNKSAKPTEELSNSLLIYNVVGLNLDKEVDDSSTIQND